jgi:hypothetical protein
VYILVQLALLRLAGSALGTLATLSAFALTDDQLLRKSSGNLGISLTYPSSFESQGFLQELQ